MKQTLAKVSAAKMQLDRKEVKDGRKRITKSSPLKILSALKFCR